MLVGSPLRGTLRFEVHFSALHHSMKCEMALNGGPAPTSHHLGFPAEDFIPTQLPVHDQIAI